MSGLGMNNNILSNTNNLFGGGGLGLGGYSAGNNFNLGS
jgi:hypothetical protein